MKLQMLSFEECLKKVKLPSQIKKNEYLDQGKYPVVSQEASLVSGYYNDVSKVFKIEKPIIIFGDHTQVLKYIDFDFIIGADGTKILQPIEKLNSKYFFYYLTLNMPASTGYARHYKLLKKLDIYFPSLEEQQRIVAKLDTTFAEINKVIELSYSRKFQSEQLLKKMLSKEFCKSPNRQSMTFADVCTLQRGFDLPKSKRRAGRYPLYSANGITDYIDVSKINAPGVITGRSGTIGAAHYIEKEFWPLNTSLYVKDFKGNLPKYVFYFLKSFNLKKYASGTGVPTLNRNVLSDKIVWISGKQNEQQEICEKLDEATEQVTSLNQILNKQLANYQALKLTILAQELQRKAA